MPKSYTLRTIAFFLTVIFSAVNIYADKAVDVTTLGIVGLGWREYCDPEDMPTQDKGPGYIPSEKPSSFACRIPLDFEYDVNAIARDGFLQSSGIYVRFRTDARKIGVKYKLRYGRNMNHMAGTGVRGVDLYCLDEDSSTWYFAGSHIPAATKDQEGYFQTNFDGKEHEFILNLPLYDGVNEMYVLVPDDAEITAGDPELIDMSTRTVAYGTSIMQGACASRPGMAQLNILGRMLNSEIINLGTSSGGQAEIGAAKMITTIPDVSAYIYDASYNISGDRSERLTYDFLKTLREANPDAAIIVLPRTDAYFFDASERSIISSVNDGMKRAFDRIESEYPGNLIWVDNSMLHGSALEGSVDGAHLTDLGMMEYARLLYPVLAPYVKGRERLFITSPSDNAEALELEPEFVWNKPFQPGTLQISASEDFNDNEIVYTREGKGRVEVEPLALQPFTKYYARISYYPAGSAEMRTSAPITFTTEGCQPDAPETTYPVQDGSLREDEAIEFSPSRGTREILFEISTDESFSAEIASFAGFVTKSDKWVYNLEVNDIMLGDEPLEENRTYWIRARASYVSGPTGIIGQTDWNEPVRFTFARKPEPEIPDTPSFIVPDESGVLGNDMKIKLSVHRSGMIAEIQLSEDPSFNETSSIYEETLTPENDWTSVVPASELMLDEMPLDENRVYYLRARVGYIPDIESETEDSSENESETPGKENMKGKGFMYTDWSLPVVVQYEKTYVGETSPVVDPSTEETTYGIDGLRLDAPRRGVPVIKVSSDGNTTKAIAK